jgi:hypothetical protein
MRRELRGLLLDCSGIVVAIDGSGVKWSTRPMPELFENSDTTRLKRLCEKSARFAQLERLPINTEPRAVATGC